LGGPYFWLMLKRLHLKNFTVFADADFEFSPGLNVLVGTNGTGKSHVLKVGYAVEAVRAEIEAGKMTGVERVFIESYSQESSVPWGVRLIRILPELFTSDIKNLIRNGNTVRECSVEVYFNYEGKLGFKLYENNQITVSENEVNFSGVLESNAKNFSFPVFIPAKEILTLSWMIPASEQLIAPIEQNYLDLLGQLHRLPLRNPVPIDAIAAITSILGGELREEENKYYLVDKTGRRTNISMVAEGLRKFGTLQKLLTNGSLTKNTTLFWDEPEANLNPALLRKLAAILAELARQGFQIILATHSTDLLKEFHILSRQKDAQPLPIKYFGLNTEPGEATRIVSTDNFEHLPDVVALEAELAQVDELDAIFAREDRERHANL